MRSVVLLLKIVSQCCFSCRGYFASKEQEVACWVGRRRFWRVARRSCAAVTFDWEAVITDTCPLDRRPAEIRTCHLRNCISILLDCDVFLMV